MERVTTINEAKDILEKNFIGPEELSLITDKMGITAPTDYPQIQFSTKELYEKRKDYILILGGLKMKNGKPITINNLRDHFGINPKISEPCFYNQDWYINETFINESINQDWYFIKKEVIESTRAKQPEDILKKNISLPTAILAVYTFFTYFFLRNEILWKHDFIWCNNLDHNGDRIYVGKYLDIDGINKNGFSIHRHLSLRHSYGAISVY